MENERRDIADLYIPRKRIADVNEEGVVAGSVKTYAVSGMIHDRDESDNSIDRLATQDGHPQNVWSYQR
ncbi:40S ribosomal protein S21 [Coemansia sp. RSA 1250]|nr:40S ribosomal protein S21 [Coemansia sp. RSA 1250]